MVANELGIGDLALVEIIIIQREYPELAWTQSVHAEVAVGICGRRLVKIVAWAAIGVRDDQDPNVGSGFVRVVQNNPLNGRALSANNDVEFEQATDTEA